MTLHKTRKILSITHLCDVHVARREAKDMATVIGLKDRMSEEITIAVSELASNLAKHAIQGTLTLKIIDNNGRAGIQVESLDNGPGISDVERAMTDGFSTTDGLGCGLGTVNRLMDEFEIISKQNSTSVTHIICRKWDSPAVSQSSMLCPLEFGAATRAHPGMSLNGDAFVIKQWDENTLVAVIDGLGHGQFAHKAAESARQFIETHFEQTLPNLFLGVGRSCRSTRGVVMALAQFNWRKQILTFASIGNVETRILGGTEKFSPIIRRGIIGGNSIKPVITEYHWSPGQIMVFHTDGLSTRWRKKDFSKFENESAKFIALLMLRTLAKNEDDATVVVVRTLHNESKLF